MPTNTRNSYQRLGLNTRNPSDYLPLQHTRPKMSDISADYVKKMVEEALPRQREDMMSKFLEILKTQKLPNSVAPFHGNKPFKVQVNFDIPNFEGKVNTEAVDNWLQNWKDTSL